MMGGCQVLFEGVFQGLWQGNDTVFSAFTIMNGDGALTKIEVFDSESEGFHDPQPGTIHELGCKLPGIFETGDEGTDLGPSHDDGRAALATGWGEVIKGEFRNSKDVFDEEDDGIERLTLGGWSDVLFEGEALEVGRNCRRSGVVRGLAEFFVTEADEAAIPINVGFLGGNGVVFESDGAAEVVDEFGEFGFGMCGLFWRLRL